MAIYYLDSSEDLSAMYSALSSLVSLLVLLKIKNENGNIERSFAVIIKVKPVTDSIGHNTS
jgi:hypothetical protein